MKHSNYRAVFRLYEYIQPFLKYSTPVEDRLHANRIAVIAPHQDDEAIGCGGTIIKYTKAKGHAETIFCTHCEFERMEEAKRAAKILGVKRNHFLQFDNKTLYKHVDELAKTFTKLFDTIKPDIIFLPFAVDNHPSHLAVSKAFLKSYKQKKLKTLVYAYSIWTTLLPNVTSDISSVWAEKQKAIECYKTQLATRDYVKMASSVAKYWAVVKGKNIEYCEAFFKMTSEGYISLLRNIL